MKKVVTISNFYSNRSPSEKILERKVTEKWKNKKDLLEKANQLRILNQIYLDEKFEGCDDVKRELKNKLNSYKFQDTEKKKLAKDNFISWDQMLEKLVLSKLICYYCKQKMSLMYSQVRENSQWTLDRLNNDIGHDNSNVVIACLKCNLKRRTTNSEKFKFTKQMRIIKKS